MPGTVLIQKMTDRLVSRHTFIPSPSLASTIFVTSYVLSTYYIYVRGKRQEILNNNHHYIGRKWQG